MKKFICIIIINVIISHLGNAQDATLDTNTILIGEQIKLTITNPIESTEIWPVYDKSIVDGIEIIMATKIDTINNSISQQFTITAWDSGSYYIPPISFSKNSKTEGILLNVQTLILEEGAELKDIRQPINEPIGWSEIWPWLLGILIITTIIYLIKRYILTKKETSFNLTPKAIVPADIIAIKQLTKLENSKIWQAGNIKEYHAELSQIIRRYAENRFNFIALEMTTDEIIQETQSILNSKELSNLKTILVRSDLAKFAKSKPNNKENTESMILAKEFVNSTKKIKEND